MSYGNRLHLQFQSYINLTLFQKVAGNKIKWITNPKVLYTEIHWKLCGNCTFPQNFDTRKLCEITAFYAVKTDGTYEPIHSKKRNYQFTADVGFQTMQSGDDMHREKWISWNIQKEVKHIRTNICQIDQRLHSVNGIMRNFQSMNDMKVESTKTILSGWLKFYIVRKMTSSIILRLTNTEFQYNALLTS